MKMYVKIARQTAVFKTPNLNNKNTLRKILHKNYLFEP